MGKLDQLHMMHQKTHIILLIYSGNQLLLLIQAIFHKLS
jgi:hypothetical protein